MITKSQMNIEVVKVLRPTYLTTRAITTSQMNIEVVKVLRPTYSTTRAITKSHMNIEVVKILRTHVLTGNDLPFPATFYHIDHSNLTIISHFGLPFHTTIYSFIFN